MLELHHTVLLYTCMHANCRVYDVVLYYCPVKDMECSNCLLHVFEVDCCEVYNWPPGSLLMYTILLFMSFMFYFPFFAYTCM